MCTTYDKRLMKLRLSFLQIIILSAVLLSSISTPHASLSGLKNVTGSVFVIVMENKSWSLVKGSNDAPYVNSLLTNPQASYARNYNNPPGIHPSELNYIWMEAGSNYGITDDNDPTHPANRIWGQNHFVKQLEAAGISWKTYQENISGTRCPLSSSFPYAAKHNPFVFFDDVTEGFNPASKRCMSHVRPFGELISDLANNTVARYVFISPNLCNDMHNTCAPTNNRIKQGDNWLKIVVPAIMVSSAYKKNGALIITWDEASSGDGPIGFILLSPQAKGKGHSNSIYYTHSSLLRSLEYTTGVHFLNDAKIQSDLSDLFK